MKVYLAHMVAHGVTVAGAPADQEVVRWLVLALAKMSLEAQRPEVVAAAERVRERLMTMWRCPEN